MTQKQIENYLKKNWLTKPNDELAKHIGNVLTQTRAIARARC